MANVRVPIWDGNPGPVSGSTPFGYYDNDSLFQTDAPKIAKMIANRLGYPVMDVELTSGSIYSVIEESITEYSSIVNQYNTIDNFINIQGSSTENVNLSGKVIKHSLDRVISLAKNYSAEVGAGGNIDWLTGSIDLQSGVQDYDLQDLYTQAGGSGSIEIKRIFHQAIPANLRYFDPNLGNRDFLNALGLSGYAQGVTYTLTPYTMFEDLIRMQAIEFNDQFRKSTYSFELINSKLRIFPVPDVDHKLYYHYIKTDDRRNVIESSGSNVVSDASNVPYNNLEYSKINDMGRTWIKNYALALAKESLGLIRGKYPSIPIPNSTITLNANDLLIQAQEEKEKLKQELTDLLNKLSKRSQLEKMDAEVESMNNQLRNIPRRIYIK
jgi:hypothetical protein